MSLILEFPEDHGSVLVVTSVNWAEDIDGKIVSAHANAHNEGKHCFNQRVLISFLKTEPLRRRTRAHFHTTIIGKRRAESHGVIPSVLRRPMDLKV